MNGLSQLLLVDIISGIASKYQGKRFKLPISSHREAFYNPVSEIYGQDAPEGPCFEARWKRYQELVGQAHLPGIRETQYLKIEKIKTST